MQDSNSAHKRYQLDDQKYLGDMIDNALSVKQGNYSKLGTEKCQLECM